MWRLNGKPRRLSKDYRLNGRRAVGPSVCFSRKFPICVIVGLCVGFYLFYFYRFDSMNEEPPSYVTVVGSRFEAECRPLRFVGFNTHDLVQAATMTPYDYNMKGGMSGRARIREMFRTASAVGLNVMRTWIHTDDPKFPFQKKPGEYDKITLHSLDYILDEARRYGIRVILSFIDNWKYYNGVDQYIDWSRTTPKRIMERPRDKDGDPLPLDFENEEIRRYETERHALFFTDSGCKEMYKNHVRKIVNRENTSNGIRYKNDPTILAWDLINEPRCETWAVPNCGDDLQLWLEEMSSFLRAEDPNHLITIGSDGFFAKDSEYTSHNPQEWSGALGQDWMRNHAIKDIDFATVHVWPNNWNRTDIGFQDDWVRIHIEAAEMLQKPLLLEEFGKRIDEDDKHHIAAARDPVYQHIYSILETDIMAGKNVSGSLFWRWNLPLYDHNERGGYGVQPSHTTFQLIKKHAEFIHSVNRALPPRQPCLHGCWIPTRSFMARKCVQKPDICQSLALQVNLTDSHMLERDVHVHGRTSKLRDMKIFSSKKECCRPGLGAFERGCSWFVM